MAHQDAVCLNQSTSRYLWLSYCAVLLLVSTTTASLVDCGSLRSCSSCTDLATCGWCSDESGSSRCVQGNLLGAADGRQCMEWMFETCPVQGEDHCTVIASCSGCFREEGCGFCRSLGACISSEKQCGEWVESKDQCASLGCQHITRCAECVANDCQFCPGAVGCTFRDDERCSSAVVDSDNAYICPSADAEEAAADGLAPITCIIIFLSFLVTMI